MPNQTFLGLDLSTQSLTALIIDPENGDVIRHSFDFDAELPEYGTTDGVLPSTDPLEAFVNPLMWVEALDRVLLWIRDQGLAGSIAAVSVSAQQHGSVYLNDNWITHLDGLDPDSGLHLQLTDVFSRTVSPIWMDSSTSAECSEITDALGGEEEMVRLTGSPATERFAGPQIRKFWKNDPASYRATTHIALISSFITGLLIGKPSPLDCGDGLGMNLADVQTRNWNPRVVDASAPDLGSKLPKILDRDQVVGRVSDYLWKRYGFDPGCQVIVGTGDNPASLAGLGLVGEAAVRAVSLGTSDTYFGYIPEPPTRARSTGHVFGTADGGLMFLICFKNGSLARERIKQQYGLTWNEFSDILLNTPPGLQGRVMLPYFMPEITPVVLEPGIRRFAGLSEDDVPGNVRAVAEAQMMSMYLHSGWAGKRPGKILVTAGGSGNQGLLKVIAQVFGAEVRAFELTDGAALGAAIRAAEIWYKERGKTIDTSSIIGELAGFRQTEVIRATREETAVFQGNDGLLTVYRACEKHHLESGPDPSEVIERYRAAHR